MSPPTRSIPVRGRASAILLETKTLSESLPVEHPSIAVAIPCYNEAAAVPTVVAQWRAALPGAEIIIFDNNSTDDTGEIARGLGVRVVPVPERGKGHAVRAAFTLLADRRAVVLVDGDGTYPAEAVGALLAPILDGSADMAVGARRPVAEPGAMTPVRGLGNVLIRAAFRALIGRGPGDLLSGYRAVSPRFLRSVRLRSRGFEIEAELTSEAVAHHLRVVEIPVAYHPRIAGTASKLRAVRDGLRILDMIATQGVRLRPGRTLTLVAAALALLAALVAVGSRQ
jgi:glycosyltransferase involved in cell wall biosynthesis